MTRLLLVTGLLLLTTGLPRAQDLTYQPINPSFGGSALNSTHLQGLATAQRNATAWDYEPPAARATSQPTARSQTDLFVSQLQSRLMSTVSTQVVEAMFGENPQDQGSVTFGTTSIDFYRDSGAINLTIIDSLDGSVTEISVPLLVAN
ncbi:curli assembly protein CsgF [Sagittula sp. S175]|uniref:curli assembly protein CsgF n=1 Tax=Sagittula sp. S175 TaxID=3415129 RepID=UPI003C7B7368